MLGHNAQIERISLMRDNEFLSCLPFFVHFCFVFFFLFFSFASSFFCFLLGPSPPPNHYNLHVTCHPLVVSVFVPCRQKKRKGFEDNLRRQRQNIGVWIKYAEWEDSQNEWQRYLTLLEVSCSYFFILSFSL